MKKVLFVSNRSNISTGSYRIWVNDLNKYFNSIGIPSKIKDHSDNIEEYDIIICSKSDVDSAVNIKKKYPHLLVGVINLAADKLNLPIDFIITGSLEEMDSLSSYENVFLFPLIEKIYNNMPIKKHIDRQIIRLGFHGSHTHLAKFNPNLKSALEELDNKINMELLIVTSDPNFRWEIGKPNIKNIIVKKWDINSVATDLLSCDIGLVPNISTIKVNDYRTSKNEGLYNTDYILRMKNKSNAGRAFVFHQLGIPIVADLTPSHFHILGNPDCGFIASSKNGWKKSILKLLDVNKRNCIALEAKKEFNRLYNPLIWAKKLYNNIGELYV